MRVAWLEPPSLSVQGDQIYRTVHPCQSLAKRPGYEVVAGHWLQPVMHEAAETADVLVLCQAIDIDFLPLMARRKRAGRATLVELNDNFLEPRAFGEVGSFYHQASQTSLVMQLATLADGLMVSTPYLGQLFGFLNPVQLVLPNSIHCALGAPRKGSSNLRIGWAGSAGHAPDVAALVPVLRRLLSQHPQLTLCIMAPAALHPLFDWVPPGRLDMRDASGLQDYLEFIATWDVGLAPLLDTPFNRGRSDIKFLEYTTSGVATVASRGPAYHTVVHDETGLLVDDFSQFIAAVTTLIEAPQKRAALVARAQRYAIAHRGHGPVHEKLQRYVETIAPQIGGNRKPGWLGRLTANRAPACAAAPATKTFQYLSSSPAEAQLFCALRSQQHTGDCAPMLQAQANMPSCHLPHLYAGASCADASTARRHLQHAQKLAPHSLAVAHHLTRTHLAAGDAAEAARLARTHLQALPKSYGYAPLWELLALAHRTLGEPAAEAQALMGALEANGAYGPPARGLAAAVVDGGLGHEPCVLQSARAAETAAAALRRNLAGFQPSFADAYFLGRLAADLGAWPDALRRFNEALNLAQRERHEEGSRSCLAWLAKAALATGDVSLARRCLARSGPSGRAATGAAHNMTQ